jgi:Na+/proline symporter
MMDFYKPLESARGAPAKPEAHYLHLARLATLAWGGVLLLIGWMARTWGSVLEAGLSIASILYGSLLGVFCLGLLTRSVGQRAAIAGMIAGLSVMAYVKGFTSIAWTWYVVIGTTTTFVVGRTAALWLRESTDG